MSNEVYLGKCEGFEAVIKAVPADFIVSELSGFKGNLQEVSSSSLKREGLHDEHSSTKRRRIEDDVIPSANGASTNLLESPVDEHEYENRLLSIIGGEMFSSLKSFAKLILDDLGTLTSDDAVTLVLGNFMERDERTKVHLCTRFLFPHLKTVTKPQTGVVTARACPNFHKFENLLGLDSTRKLFRFIHVEISESMKQEIELDGEFGKDTRRQVHHLISGCFGKFLEARTLPAPAESLVRRIAIRRKPHLRKKDEKIESTDIITAFTLWKRNCETYAAIHHIGNHLHIPHHMFSFAGIKDKRAVTTQKCTVNGISPEKLDKACKSLPKYLRVSDACAVSRMIRLGELDGNRFCVKLTHIRRLDTGEMGNNGTMHDLIEAALEDVKVSGFVNYFGPQRFGRSVAQCKEKNGSRYQLDLEAPAVGLAMLQNDFEKAVNLLLSPTKDQIASSTDENKAKIHFQATKNVEETLHMMPSNKLRELAILRTLKRFNSISPETCAKALLSLPHNSRLLYVHSFCSFIWNEMATKRINRYGNKAVPGDLARKSGIANDTSEPAKVLIVSKEDVENGRVSFEDVILPIPGYQISYPPCMAEDYRELLRNFSIDDSHPFRILSLKLNAPGAYRKLMTFPGNLSFKFVSCRKPKIPKNFPFPAPQSECFKDFADGADENVDESSPTDVVKEFEDPVEGDIFLGNEKQDTEKGKSAEGIPAMTSQIEHSGKLTSDLRMNDITSECQNDLTSSETMHEGFDILLNFDLPPSCYATTFLSAVTKGHLK